MTALELQRQQAAKQSIDPKKLITSKAADRFAWITCALAAAYFLGHLVWAGVRP